MNSAAGSFDRYAVIEALENVAQYGTAPKGLSQILDIGSRPFLDYFSTEVLDELVFTAGATCKFVEGAYGSGKTHLLDLLQNLALEQGMAVVRTDLQQALGLDDWRSITRHVLERIEAPVAGTLYRSLPQILEAMAAAEIGRVESLRRAHLPHAGFARAMTLLAGQYHLTEAGRQLLRQYLVGEAVTARELRFYRVDGVKNPLSVRNAEQVLKTTLSGLHHLGSRGTLLLFDENERTFVFHRRNPPQRVVRGANLMRRLIDGCAAGSLASTVAVFFVLPNFVQNCGLAYPALGQRLQIPPRRGQYAPWRWPVLSIADIAPNTDPERFLAEAVQRLSDLAARCHARLDGLGKRMQTAGRAVLQDQAGSGYRRPLMKRLATLVVQEITTDEH